MTPYCLQCFAPIPAAQLACPHCDFVNYRVRRARYWNRLPHLVRLERRLKALIAVLTVLACAAPFVLAGLGIHVDPAIRIFGRPAGWSVAGPVLPGAALWATASKLTAHGHYFRAGLFWPLCFAALALVGAGIDARLSAASILLGVISVVAATRGARWKRRLIDERLERAAMADGGATEGVREP